MMPPLLKLCVRLLLVLSAISVAPALEVDDRAHGFHFSLPDDFVERPNPKSADIQYSYLRGPTEPGQAATLVDVTIVDGTITAGERINPSKIPEEKGMNIGFDQIEWQTQKMDVIIGTPTDPEKAHVRVFSCIFPLAGNAVRLRVAGPASGEDSARAVFDKTVAGFTGDKLKMKPERSPLQSMGAFAFQLTFGLVIAVVLGRMIMRIAGGKKKKPKQGPPPAGPPPIRRPR